MKAMILAAGLGTRLGKLTKDCPKPLLPIHGRPLIEYALEKLKRAGFTSLVINVSYHADKIIKHLGDGRQWGVNITYSLEETPLETGGGIFQALPLLGSEPFVVINSDLWTNYPLEALHKQQPSIAHLILVNNPEHNPSGDFGLQASQLTLDSDYTFSGIGVYHPALFAHCLGGAFKLAPLLKQYAERSQITAEHYSGMWLDIGSPDRLAILQSMPLTHSFIRE